MRLKHPGAAPRRTRARNRDHGLSHVQSGALLLIISVALLTACCGTTQCRVSLHRDETPVLLVRHYGGFGPLGAVATVAAYRDGTLLEWRDNDVLSCRLIGERELRILSAIMDRNRALELLERELAVAGCCNQEDSGSMYWQVGDKAYHLTHDRKELLPLARDLDRFFSTYLGERTYVTPFAELRR